MPLNLNYIRLELHLTYFNLFSNIDLLNVSMFPYHQCSTECFIISDLRQSYCELARDKSRLFCRVCSNLNDNQKKRMQ